METVKRAITWFFDKIDWLLLTLCTSLSLLSVILLMGIFRYKQAHEIDLMRLSRQNITSQGIAIVLGVIAVLLIANIDYRSISKQWKIYVPAAYLFMLATFAFGVGATGRPDDKRWLIVPGVGMSVQPSEFLKLAFILSFAYHAHRSQDKFNRPLNVALLCLHAVIPVALVQFQGDSGTALLFCLIFLAMLFVAGIKWIYILIAAVGVPVMLPLAWFFLLEDFQRNRILAVIAPTGSWVEDQQGRGLLAIASGRIFGKGIFSVDHKYVPEMHNDFIFSFIGSAMGFLGCLAVCLVIGFIGMRMLYICALANDRQGQVICAGIFSMIISQSVINIGMNLSLLPVIGNALPFLSSGGSSLLANYLGVGLVLSVCKHTRRKPKVERFLP